MGLSLKPETFVAGGLPVGEMEIVGAGFEIYDFGGKANKEYAEPTVLRLDLKLADGTEHQEHLSCGSSDRVIPTNDGNEIDGQNENVTGIGQSTAIFLFVTSMKSAGVPDKVLDGKASSLVGMKFIAMRPPLKGTDGVVKKRTDAKGREYDQTYFAMDKLLSLPGEKGSKAKAKPTAATKATTKVTPVAAPADTSEVSEDTTAKAMEMVMGVIGEAGGTMPVMNLRVKMFAACKALDPEEKAAVLKLVNSNEWLAENGFTINGKDISA